MSRRLLYFIVGLSLVLLVAGANFFISFRPIPVVLNGETVIEAAFRVRSRFGEGVDIRRVVEAVDGSVEVIDPETLVIRLREKRYVVTEKHPEGEQAGKHLNAPVFWIGETPFVRGGTLLVVLNEAIGITYWEVKGGKALLDLKR